MALIKCAECGREFSDKATACPQCAAPRTPALPAGVAEDIDVQKLAAKIHPAERIKNAGEPDGMFRDAVAYLVAQNKLVEPLYQMEKEGKLTGEGDKGLAGKEFLNGQLVKAGQMLGDIWYTAWQEAPEDQYLAKQLQERNAAQTPAGKKP